MATMTIRITVQAKGITWSRTASVEVDTANYQQGDSRNNILFGIEGTSLNIGQHSYTGVAVGVFANKAKGSVTGVQFYESSTAAAGVYVQTHLPFIIYSGAGGGLTGAVNGSATSTDIPTLDVESAVSNILFGAQNMHCLAGLKAIS